MDQRPPQPMPNGERAVVELEKLRDYCLSPIHFRGRHKAKVFLVRLGLTAEHAEWLRECLLLEAKRAPAQFGVNDAYGQRFVIDFDLTTGTGSATVRSSWIILTHEDFPRLTGCFVR